MHAAAHLDDTRDRVRNPPDLQAKFYDLLAQIPRGRVCTYAALAEALGDRRAAARWVGQEMLDHDHTGDCPCFRVVRSDGRLGRYIVATDGAQARLLALDRVTVEAGRVDLGRYGFERFSTNRPLVALRKLQRSLRRHVQVDGISSPPDRVGGVDVSYASPCEGVAGYALLDTSSGELLWSTTVRASVQFPYIPTYLAFRELPLLLALIDEVRRAGWLAPVVLVDGSGTLHPSGMGIATTLGILADVPTIGVAKKLLCGTVCDGGASDTSKTEQVVQLDGVPTASALWTSPRSRRPIYVSPGSGVSLTMSTQIAWQSTHGHRLPEPLWWADRLSRQAARSTE
jgi:deoxyribonuclease V